MQIQKKNQNKQFLETQLISYCPLCHHSFSPHEAAVIGQGSDTHLLYIHCRHCASALVVLMLVNELGISSVGVVTDCTEADIIRCKDGQLVTTDDCLAVHAWLQAGCTVV